MIISRRLLMLLGMFLSSLAAADTLNFIGAVNDTTCDVQVETSGATANVVNLGRVGVNDILNESQIVRFVLKPDLTQSDCQGLGAQNTVTIHWVGDFSAGPNNWGMEGMLAAQSGEAKDAGVLLIHDRSPQMDAFIGRDMPASSVGGDKFVKEGAKYMAVLIPGKLTGTFQAAAAFVMTYN